MRLYTNPNDRSRLHIDGDVQGGYVVLSQGGAVISVPVERYPAFLDAQRDLYRHHHLAAVVAEARQRPRVCADCGAALRYDEAEGWQHDDAEGAPARDHPALPMHPA